MSDLQLVTVPTYWTRIYLSGPIEVAKQSLRGVCMNEGLCVTIDPTHYLYAGGEEAGYVVGLLNYPRFPCDADVMTITARRIALALMRETHQWSALIVNPELTEWYSCRPTPDEEL